MPDKSLCAGGGFAVGGSVLEVHAFHGVDYLVLVVVVLLIVCYSVA